jgi:hypothetical protein
MTIGIYVYMLCGQDEYVMCICMPYIHMDTFYIHGAYMTCAYDMAYVLHNIYAYGSRRPAIRTNKPRNPQRLMVHPVTTNKWKRLRKQNIYIYGMVTNEA